MSGLKVIGVGFARTGTSSLKTALNRLGFNCYHMFEIYKRPSHASLWIRALDGKENRQQIFEEIFQDFEATVDFPAALFFRDLLEYYPEAKFILTMRDSDAWYASFYETIIRAQLSIPRAIGEFLKTPKFYIMLRKLVNTLFNGRISDREYVIQVYERRNAEIIKHIPADRLLIFNVQDDWKPLCEFLKVPVPEDMPFPRINERKEMLELVNRLIRLGWLCIILFVGGLLAIFWYFFQT